MTLFKICAMLSNANNFGCKWSVKNCLITEKNVFENSEGMINDFKVPVKYLLYMGF